MSILLRSLRAASPRVSPRTNLRKRNEFRTLTSFSDAIAAESNKFHVYISGVHDPYLNLSIEHYIYEKSAPGSTILLLYINDPCVVIGRNQNPWLEANLQALSHENIPLIRRRSGGGTVFHDHGNVNFSVIYPPSDFTRDKYAELVTRALRPYQARVRVNERHDIVVDQGQKLDGAQNNGEDMHFSGYGTNSPRKCSGSAYKLSRNRALHHGTCLVDSANLSRISAYLRSPLEPYVKARGVDSVKSPVTNVFPSDYPKPVETFIQSVITTFDMTHQLGLPPLMAPGQHTKATRIQQVDRNTVHGLLGQDLQEMKRIQKGVQELKAPSWLWEQTPRFDFSTYSTEEDNRARPELPVNIPKESRFRFSSRSGQILSVDLSMNSSTQTGVENLIGSYIHRFDRWEEVLKIHSDQDLQADLHKETTSMASWLDMLFGKVKQV